MAKSAEVKLAIFGRAGVGKSGKILACSCCVCGAVSVNTHMSLSLGIGHTDADISHIFCSFR
jgi:hypothetical protein